MAAGLNLRPQRNVHDGRLFLDLSNQGLTSIPEEVFDITDLEILIVSNNKLTSIPEAIGRLQKLRRLDAYGNKLTSLPQAIASLQGLEKLYVHSNNLKMLPEGLEALQNLGWLWVKDNELTKLPTKLFSCLNLVNFHASNNKLSTLPPGVEKLQKLRVLCIEGNHLKEVPPGVCSLSNLEVLSVSNNILSTLPPGVEKLQKLRGLYINNNQLTEVPPGVCSLSNLEVLNVGPNPIKRLPDGLRRLTMLKVISVSDCQFKEFPRQMLELKTLEKLYADGCEFNNVPDEVGTLQHMWVLHLKNNLLSTLPSTMSNLHNLREVGLWDNRFFTFPEVLCELPAMEKLDISANHIARLPTTLHRAEMLKDLDVSDNPLTYPPQDVCAQGTFAIMAFLKEEAEKEGEKRAGREGKDLGVGKVTGKVRDVHLTASKERTKRAGQEEKDSGAGKGTGKVPDVQVAPAKAHKTETAAETELERKLRERREKIERMQQQDSQLQGQTAGRVDISKVERLVPAQTKTAGTDSQTGVHVRQKLPVPAPGTLKLSLENTPQDKELLQAFNRLSVKVGQNQWKPIARELGFSSQEIRDIQSESPDDQMYETLVRWRRRAGPAASLAGLEQCLRDLELTELADYIRIVKDRVCDYQLACQRFKKSLGINDSYFSHEQDKCFCKTCHKARGDKDSYSRGEPGKKYAVPVGWTRFGLSLNPTFKDSELNVFENWHRAYHGTHPDVVKKILQNSSQLLMPGDVALGGRKLGEREGHFTPTRKPDGFDTAQVFVTPSIVYAGLDAYASPKRFEDDGKVYKARVAFQLCIRPDSYEIGPETVGAKREGKVIDPLCSNDELEWSTKERGSTALYGLLVKLEPLEESDEVDFDKLYAEQRSIKTFEMLYLLGALRS